MQWLAMVGAIVDAMDEEEPPPVRSVMKVFWPKRGAVPPSCGSGATGSVAIGVLRVLRVHNQKRRLRTFANVKRLLPTEVCNSLLAGLSSRHHHLLL